MSDLANCCEYLTIDKLCTAVLESEKAKAKRCANCRNDEKLSCCYLCSFKPECAISCNYLGKTHAEPVTVEPQKDDLETNLEKPQDTPSNAQNTPVAWCCGTEMSWAKTKLSVDEWKGAPSKFGKVLPVIVYTCSICGKIEFKVGSE